MRLANKVALITGSSRGLGLALAGACARQGAAVVLNARHAGALARAEVALRDAAPAAQILSVVADAADPSGVEQLVGSALQRFGRIDILVNNASVLGPVPRRSLLDHTYEEFLEVLRINTAGPFLVTRAVLPTMLAQGQGSIINVISEAGLNGYPEWGVYGVSKAGLELLTQTWAAEIEGSGVRINSIDPGEMDTQMHYQAYPDEDRAQYPAPDQLVEPFIYLASDESAAIHGQRLIVQAEE